MENFFPDSRIRADELPNHPIAKGFGIRVMNGSIAILGAIATRPMKEPSPLFGTPRGVTAISANEKVMRASWPRMPVIAAKSGPLSTSSGSGEALAAFPGMTAKEKGGAVAGAALSNLRPF